MVDLQQFCSVETAWGAREELLHPFSRGAWHYATNGHIIVRKPRVVEDWEATWPKIETVMVSLRTDGLAPLPAIEIEPPHTCAMCAGFGRVRPCRVCNDGCKRCDFGLAPARKPQPEQETCPRCEGRRTVWDEHAVVHLTPRLAIAPLYYSMLRALPGTAIDLTVDGLCDTPAKTVAMNPVSFTFDGGEGLVMPMRIYKPIQVAA